MNPSVSVLMSVYNTEEPFLRESVESILNQTYRDYEFVIINDCSTDRSLDILNEYASADHRIHIINNNVNLGLTKSLNRGLKACSGKYIVRMDSDDISLPERIYTQVTFMETHPEICVAGSYVFINKDSGLINRGFNSDPEINRIQMLFLNAGVPHPTAIIRRSFLEQHNIEYDERIKKSQDYALWYDCVKAGGQIGLIKKILLKYRVHAGQISSQNSDQMKYAKMVTEKAYRDFARNPEEDSIALHCSLAVEVPNYPKRSVISHLKKLESINKQNNYYNCELFQRRLDSLWLNMLFLRVKYGHRLDYLFSTRTLSSLRPSVIEMYKRIYVKNKQEYIKVRNDFIQSESEIQ